MANMVKFWKGLKAKYTALATKDAATLYFVTDAQELYLGSILIADATDNDLVEALKNYYTKAEVDAIIAGLDATVKGEGTYVDVTVTETDGKITAVAIDDSAIDTKLADYQPAGNYKVKQTAVADKGLTGAKVLKNLSQNENGEISYETRDLTIADIGAEAAGEAAKVLGAEGDAADKMTVYGVKAYIDQEIDGITTGAGYATTDYVDEEIEGLEFGLSPDGKELSLKNSAGTAIATLDTTQFVKDGMISSVAISEDGTKLVITWNTDAGISATEIPLTELVDVMTGVDGTTITVNVSADDKISAEVKTGSLKDGHIAADAAIAKGKLATDVQTTLTNADTAYGWGNHANAGYLKATDISGKEDKANLKALAYKDTVATADIDNDAVTADKLADAVNEDIAKGVEAQGWGNHADGGYVKHTDIANSITVGAESGGDVGYQDTTITAGGIVFASHEMGANDSSLTLSNPVPQESGNHYVLNVPYVNGTLATTDDVAAAAAKGQQGIDNAAAALAVANEKTTLAEAKNEIQGNTTATIANVVEAVNKLADGQNTTDGSLKEAESNIKELLTALTWIEG